MATVTRGLQDEAVLRLKSALDEFERTHPGAEATLYRQNSGTVRVRVVDRRFAGMKRSARHDSVWNSLAQQVGDDVLQEIGVILPLAPDELGSSLMNLEFETPVSSDL